MGSQSLAANTKAERNYGIDLLRIVAMFMICVLHILGHGGILDSIKPGTVNYYVALFLETAMICAVNCYAMISGFVGFGRRYKVSNVIYLWLQTAFYAVFIFAVFKIVYPDAVKLKWIAKAAFPVLHNDYWYFSAYFGLFFFMPLLNFILNNLSEKKLRVSLFCIIVVFTGASFFNKGNVFSLNRGYSTIWLVILYLVGGYFAKYQPLKKIKSGALALIIFSLVVATYILQFAVKAVAARFSGETAWWSNMIINYSSPFVFLTAAFMLEIFSRLKFKGKPRLIAFFAPLTFGVYLIHDHEYFSSNVICGRFADFVSYNPIVMTLAIVGTAICIYVGCSLIDYLRLLLFKILKVKPTLEKLENKLKNKIFKEEGNV